MNSIKLRKFGSVQLPQKYSHLAALPLRQEDAQSVGRVVTALSRGQAVIIKGCQESVTNLLSQLQDRRKQFTPRPSNRYPVKRDWERAFREMLDRVLLVVEDEAVPARLLVGEEIQPPFLCPADDFIRSLGSMDQNHYIPVLEQSIIVHHQVLIPRSHQILALYQKGLCELRPALGHASKILDMGCGSGVLSLLAARELAGLRPQVTATDHLPEAIATTILNLGTFQDQGLIPPETVTVTGGGDLFAPLTGAFDLVMFNAPWVVAPVRNPAETALNDPRQETLARFAHDLPRYLNPGGRLFLGYADNSGPRAIQGVKDLLAQNGLTIDKVLKDRIRTWRKNRAWQNIYLYQCSL